MKEELPSAIKVHLNSWHQIQRIDSILFICQSQACLYRFVLTLSQNDIEDGARQSYSWESEFHRHRETAVKALLHFVSW